MKSSGAPPLYVWIVCGVVVLSYLAWCYWYPAPGYYSRHGLWDRFQYSADRLEREWPFAEKSYKVVIWGSSLVGEGVRHRGYFKSVLGPEFCQQGVDVQKLYLMGADARQLPHVDRLLELTAKIGPDLLLIEDHVFLYQNPSGKALPWRRRFSDKTSYLLTTFQAPEVHIKEKAKFDTFHDWLSSETQKDTTEFPTVDFRIADFDDHLLLRQQLEKRGLDTIPIKVLNVPRPRDVEAQYLHQDNLQRIEKLVADYRHSDYDLAYWKYPEPLAFKYYNDHAHLNRQGRRRYSQWLAETLKTHLTAACTSSK